MKKKFSFLMIFVLIFIFCLGSVGLATGNMVVRKYSGIPQYLSEDTEPFDLVVEVLDPAHKAYQSIEPGSASASFESDEFALKDPSSLPEIKQLSVKEVEGGLRFKIIFKNVVYIGKAQETKTTDSEKTVSTNSNLYGNIALGIVYRVEDEVASSKVNISVKKTASEVKSGKVKKLPKPHIKLQKYSYGSEEIKADEKFNLEFSLINTSWNYALENVKISLNGGQIFSPTAGASNIFFEEKIGPQGELKEVMPLYVNSSAETSVQPVTITTEAEYVEDGARNELKEEVVVSIPVVARSPGLNATLKVITSAKEVSEGEDVSLKIIAKNATITKTKDIVPVAYNPSIEVRAVDGFDFDSDHSSFDLKNLLQGDPTEKTITITPKYKRNPVEMEMPEEGQDAQKQVAPGAVEEPQIFKGVVTLTYYDEGHKEYSVSRDFSFKLTPVPQMNDSSEGEIELMPEPDGAEAPTDGAKEGYSLKTRILLGSGALAVLAVVAIVVVKIIRRVRAKRSLEDDEDI